MSKRFFLTRSRHDMANHYLYACLAAANELASGKRNRTPAH